MRVTDALIVGFPSRLVERGDGSLRSARMRSLFVGSIKQALRHPVGWVECRRLCTLKSIALQTTILLHRLRADFGVLDGPSYRVSFGYHQRRPSGVPAFYHHLRAPGRLGCRQRSTSFLFPLPSNRLGRCEIALRSFAAKWPPLVAHELSQLQVAAFDLKRGVLPVGLVTMRAGVFQGDFGFVELVAFLVQLFLELQAILVHGEDLLSEGIEFFLGRIGFVDELRGYVVLDRRMDAPGGVVGPAVRDGRGMFQFGDDWTGREETAAWF